MTLTSVDLPAPFSPISAWMDPRSRVRLPERRATTGPEGLDHATQFEGVRGCGRVDVGICHRVLLVEVKVPESIQVDFSYSMETEWKRSSPQGTLIES